MVILKNERALAGERTSEVALCTAFYEELLKSEQKEIRNMKEGKRFIINHVTNADIDLMIILHKLCNTKGYIRNVSIHQIYQSYKEYFERPMSHSQLYRSFQKYVERNFIMIEESNISNLITIKLNYFWDVEKDEISRYVLISPYIFSNKFSKMTLAARKLFLLGAIRQGENEMSFIGIHSEKGLYAILRKCQPHQLRDIFEELTKGEEPLFKFISMKKEKGQYRNVYYSINKKYISKKVTENTREILPITVKYPRKTKFIESVLNEMGIGEFTIELPLIVNCLKDLSNRVIRHVLNQLRVFLNKNNKFPTDLPHFIKKETRMKRAAVIIDIARQTGVYDYIAPTEGQKDRENSIFEFVLKFSFYSNSTIEKLFKSKINDIKANFSKYVSRAEYDLNNELDSLEGIKDIRDIAYQLKIDLKEYRDLEQHVIVHKDNIDDYEKYIWLLKRLRRNDLKTLKATDIPLEEFILDQTNKALAAIKK